MVDVAEKSVGLIPQLKVRMRRSHRVALPFLQDLVVGNVEGMAADLHVHAVDFLPDVHEN